MKAQKHFKSSWILCVYCIFLPSFSFASIDGQTLTIGNPNAEFGDLYQQVKPYFYARMDAAGYSDWIWYGPSDLHEVNRHHEVLSGEWGAAIYYEGIDTGLIDPADPNSGNKAMWLTQRFEYPYWDTYNNFTAPSFCSAWHESKNPAPLMNTGKSFITNGDVNITIYYEVVDLDQLDPNRTPMAYYIPITDDPNGVHLHTYTPSDRYIFLQTYEIHNPDLDSPLENVEFYQFLHSHGADEYGATVYSSYDDTDWDDPLEQYIPYESKHCLPGQSTIGKFRYDITQWNRKPFIQYADHEDFVGFSSAREPTWVDTDTYRGGHFNSPDYRPAQGSHIHIEKRLLNENDYIERDEVGGAMGWDLGTIDPNGFVYITVAFMFAPKQETPAPFLVVKTDDADTWDCREPGEEIRYTIAWENLSDQTAYNARIIDYLPLGVSYDYVINVIPPIFDPNYDPAEHTYTWNLGTIGPYESGSVELTVEVNEKAEPGMLMRNDAEMDCSLGISRDTEYTRICCWDPVDPEIIYVDFQAKGNNTGVSWDHAYTNLQSALARAKTQIEVMDCLESMEIRVAQGTYIPGRLEDDTFEIPDNVSVYGGFKSGGCDFSARSPKRYPTILSGQLNEQTRAETVVVMGDETLLNGFTVMGASIEGYGIYGSGADFVIENCIVEKNENYGVRAQGGNVTVKWCEIRNNRQFGIWHQGADFTLTVENSQIRKNDEYGIYCINSKPIVKNSTASENDLKGFGRAGIRLFNPKYSPVLYNNTFAYNRSQGIYFTDNGTISDPNDKDWPDVQNCILWKNNTGGAQFTGFSKSRIRYSCIYDPNDPEGESTAKDGNLNFTANPKFAYYDPNNLHLAYDSPCKDAGSPYLSYDEQVDMDSEERVVGDNVDVGADELYSCDGDYSEDDFYNALDWNADGVVNLVEFTKFSRAWLSHDPNDPVWIADPNLADPNDSIRWNSVCNLADTGNSEYAIDLADLEVFVADVPWLWEACWRDNYIKMYALMGGGETLALSGAEGMMSMTMSSEESVYEEENVYAGMSEPELALFVLGIYEVIDYIDQSLVDKPENAENLNELKAFLEGVLLDIQESLQ